MFPSQEIYGWDTIISCKNVALRTSHLVLLNATRCLLNYKRFRILYLKSREVSQVPPESETFLRVSCPRSHHSSAPSRNRSQASLCSARAKDWANTPSRSYCSGTSHQQGVPPSTPRCQGEQSAVVNLGIRDRKQKQKPCRLRNEYFVVAFQLCF